VRRRKSRLSQDAVSSKTQSASPVELLPGVEKFWLPEFVNGDPGIVVELPLVESNHLAVTGPLNLLRSTVRVALWGM
jgi:hypothetical protein